MRNITNALCLTQQHPEAHGKFIRILSQEKTWFVATVNPTDLSIHKQKEKNNNNPTKFQALKNRWLFFTWQWLSSKAMICEWNIICPIPESTNICLKNNYS